MLVRVKADAIGLLAEDFLNDRVVDHDEIYSGYKDIFMNKERFASFYKNKQIPVKELQQHQVYPNQFVLMKDELGGSSSAVGMADKKGETVKDSFSMMSTYGVSGRRTSSRQWRSNFC